MKRSRAAVRGKAREGLEVRFEAQGLTSFSGLIVFQRLFAKLDLKERLRGCFRHRVSGAIYSDHVIVLLLIVHLLLGFRELRDTQYYRDDEMVKRLLGLRHLPEVSTISRMLACAECWTGCQEGSSGFPAPPCRGWCTEYGGGEVSCTCSPVAME